MNTRKLKIYVALVLMLGLTMQSCYKEQHFNFPGPYENGGNAPTDSLPFPFDKNREAGVWLMKDGVPDYGKMLFKGYTDFYAKGDTLSWIKKNDGFHLLPHYNYYPLSNADHFAGDPNAYKYNWAYSKYFVPIGAGRSFYFYTKVTFGTMSATAVGLSLGISWANGGKFVFGMDGASTAGEPKFFVDLYGTTVSVNPDLGWPTIPQVLIPGVPADLEVIIVDGLFYMKVNDILVFKFKLPSENLYYYTPQIRPWRNFVSVHDMYIESSDMYTVDYAVHEQENGYSRIQAPALAKAANGDLILFAEGRSNPLDVYERIAQNTIPVGDCDIITKRSADGGTTWSDQITVLAGEGENTTYCFPQTITTGTGEIILQYTSISGSFVNKNYVYNASSQRIFQRKSTDNGQTWSEPVDLTSSLGDNMAYLRNNAGHGISLRSEAYKNRLVMPLTYSSNVVKLAISDDDGQTWRLSQAVSGQKLQFGSIVELSDNRLMMVLGHTNTTPKNKLVSYSNDGGETWSATVNIAADVKTGDFGHLYPGVILKGKNDEILFVNSTARESDSETMNSPIYPVSPAIFTSTDEGITFPQSEQLSTRESYYGYNVPFGFMDAVVLDNGTVVIVGEGGVESTREGIVVYKK
ncbi:sialidase family protein [Gaoshiqia sp. Z1-71]|uniref:sialidase family protein n=1 Tax=Gaoshiqia hydrogeniformans TaxID=3290090 RepID=UPI003BF7C105